MWLETVGCCQCSRKSLSHHHRTPINPQLNSARERGSSKRSVFCTIVVSLHATTCGCLNESFAGMPLQAWISIFRTKARNSFSNILTRTDNFLLIQAGGPSKRIIAPKLTPCHHRYPAPEMLSSERQRHCGSHLYGLADELQGNADCSSAEHPTYVHIL